MSGLTKNTPISAAKPFPDCAEGDLVAECPEGADRNEVELAISKLSCLAHLLNERHIAELSRMIRARHHQLTAEAITVFVRGDVVLINHFRCPNLKGVVRRVNRKSLTIEADNGIVYRVSPQLCRYSSSDARSA